MRACAPCGIRRGRSSNLPTHRLRRARPADGDIGDLPGPSLPTSRVPISRDGAALVQLQPTRLQASRPVPTIDPLI